MTLTELSQRWRYLALQFLVLQLVTPVKIEKKKVDDVLGGEDAWKNVAKTDGTWIGSCKDFVKHFVTTIYSRDGAVGPL